MLAIMAKKRPKATSEHKGKPVLIRLPDGMPEALRELARRMRRRSRNEMIVVVLEDALSQEGLWPPPTS